MTCTLHISPQLIQQFNEAADLAREGEFEASLAAWNRLLNPTDEDKREKRVTTGDFLGQSYMRKAWVLMDLQRWAEAREVFEDEVLQACLGQFSTENLYEYFYSYANTLGILGEVEPMDVAFSKAMHIAAEHLGDAQRLHYCWKNLMYFAEITESWDYLLGEVDACIQLAANIGDEKLGTMGQLNKALALANLGRNAEARSIVEPAMERARATGADWVLACCAEIQRAMKD